jgi:cell fate (sporulation/competence/biofilm development) regulator YlbF (YheA/YmcA/DUF963 family)
MLDPKVEAAARALATKLKASPAIAAFWQAKAHFETNEQAQSLMTELQEHQQALLQKQQMGTLTQKDIEPLRRLQSEARDNPIIMAYLRAQQEAQAVLPEVNTELSKLLGYDFARLASGR